MHRTSRLISLAAATTLLLTACGGEEDTASTETGGTTTTEESGDAGSGGGSPLEGQTITVGSKDFDEQLVLGQIALKVLEDAGAEVVDSTNLAGTVATREALLSGQIDMYWEYTGTGWITHLGNTEAIPDSQEQWQAVKDQDAEENGVAWLDYAPLNNTYTLAVRSEDADGLETLSDWAADTQENPDAATLCIESEFANRDDGLPGLEEAYGVTVPQGNISLVDTGVVYTETDAGNCKYGEVFTTDGRIPALDLKILEDDMGFFPVYNPAPTFLEERLGELTGVEEVLAPVTEALTTEEISALNALVSVDGELPDQVAETWLTDNGFIGG